MTDERLVELDALQERLRVFVQTQTAPGCCRILSKGDECHCPICDVDDLVAAVREARAERDTARAELAEAVKLLRPFAKFSTWGPLASQFSCYGSNRECCEAAAFIARTEAAK